MFLGRFLWRANPHDECAKSHVLHIYIHESSRKRLHDDVLHISKKPLRGELSGFLSIYQAEASCISPKEY